eukprot:1821269-Amphidinium_carterae.4
MHLNETCFRFLFNATLCRSRVTSMNAASGSTALGKVIRLVGTFFSCAMHISPTHLDTVSNNKFEAKAYNPH